MSELAQRWAPALMDGARLVAVEPAPDPRDDADLPTRWLRRLYTKLLQQQRRWKHFDRYYSGDHPVPWIAEQARSEFRRLLALTRSNYMGLVVDAQVERMILEGFRVGDSRDADAETWRIWRANNMDTDLDLGLLEATKAGSAFIMVGPNPDDPATPEMSIEHPTQVAVAVTPGHRRQLDAGLKVWLDDWTGDRIARLYLPDAVIPFRARGRLTDGIAPKWLRDGEVEDNPLGEVPFWELPNNPALIGGGRSEIDDVTEIQDRINKTIADRLMTQDFGAFPQKWAVGFPEDQSVEVGRNRLVTSSVSKTDAAFGQWESAPIDPYSAAKREDVKDIASRTRTPAQYLLGEMSNVNGETLKASESGLVAKVRQRVRPHSEGVEDAVRAARKLAGVASAPRERVETIWRNPEFRTEGELVDSLVKMRTLGVPPEALWERWGATPQEIQRWRQWNEQDPELLAVRELTTGNQPAAPADDEPA